MIQIQLRWITDCSVSIKKGSKMKTITVFATLFAVALSLTVSPPVGAQYQVQNHVFGNGGSIASSANCSIGSTLGQTMIGMASGLSSRSDIGFWYLSGGYFTDVGHMAGAVPKTYWLGQNYPNPFNASTTIAYLLPEKAFVQLKIFDTLGKEVMRLVENDKTMGLHQVRLELKDFASGIYFYQFEANAFAQTKRLMLVK
jgi:hypothetical protein